MASEGELTLQVKKVLRQIIKDQIGLIKRAKRANELNQPKLIPPLLTQYEKLQAEKARYEIGREGLTRKRAAQLRKAVEEEEVTLKGLIGVKNLISRIVANIKTEQFEERATWSGGAGGWAPNDNERKICLKALKTLADAEEKLTDTVGGLTLAIRNERLAKKMIKADPIKKVAKDIKKALEDLFEIRNMVVYMERNPRGRGRFSNQLKNAGSEIQIAIEYLERLLALDNAAEKIIELEQ